VGRNRPQERINRLEKIGLVWDQLTGKWEKAFSYLKIYKEQYGDCSPDVRFKSPDGFPLGQWISHQRRLKDKLSPERIQLLEELGFSWDLLSEQWEKAFSYLKVYIDEHGDCLVPRYFSTPDGFKLGAWISNQRARRVADRLSPERIQRLDEVGFVWDSFAEQWDQAFFLLKAYKEQFGNCSPEARFKSPDGFTLGKWARLQRDGKEKLPPERVQRLDALGFEW